MELQDLVPHEILEPRVTSLSYSGLSIRMFLVPLGSPDHYIAAICHNGWHEGVVIYLRRQDGNIFVCAYTEGTPSGDEPLDLRSVLRSPYQIPMTGCKLFYHSAGQWTDLTIVNDWRSASPPIFEQGYRIHVENIDDEVHKLLQTDPATGQRHWTYHSASDSSFRQVATGIIGLIQFPTSSLSTVFHVLGYEFNFTPFYLLCHVHQPTNKSADKAEHGDLRLPIVLDHRMKDFKKHCCIFNGADIMTLVRYMRSRGFVSLDFRTDGLVRKSLATSGSDNVKTNMGHKTPLVTSPRVSIPYNRDNSDAQSSWYSQFPAYSSDLNNYDGQIESVDDTAEQTRPETPARRAPSHVFLSDLSLPQPGRTRRPKVL